MDLWLLYVGRNHRDPFLRHTHRFQDSQGVSRPIQIVLGLFVADHTVPQPARYSFAYWLVR